MMPKVIKFGRVFLDENNKLNVHDFNIDGEGLNENDEAIVFMALVDYFQQKLTEALKDAAIK